jgi:hypothetical protein
MHLFKTLFILALGIGISHSAAATSTPSWSNRGGSALQPEFFTIGALYRAGMYSFPNQTKNAFAPFSAYEKGISNAYGITVSCRMHRSGMRLHTGILQTVHAYVHVLQDVFDPAVGLGEFKTHYAVKYLTIPLAVSFSDRHNRSVKPYGKMGVNVNVLESVQSNSGAFGSAVGIENPHIPYTKADYRGTSVLFQLSAGSEIYLSEDQALSIVPEFSWQFAFEGDKQSDFFNRTGQSNISVGMEVRYHFYAHQTLKERREQHRKEIEAKRKELEDKINNGLQNVPNTQTP